MRFLSGFLLVAALLSATAIDSKLKRAFASITPEGLLGHIRALSSDEYGGRGPGTEGERETVDYLIAQCRQMGLRPGNPDGTFTQNVPLWSIRSTGTMQVTANGQEIPMQAGTDYEATSNFPQEQIAISQSPLVFAGYGAVAPEYGWDDYKGIDVKGKTVVLLPGDPPVPDRGDPAKLDEKMFAGKGLSYYGRPSTSMRPRTREAPLL